jgi:ComF family protein
MRSRWLDQFKSWLEAMLGLFYPEVCQQCGLERATAADGFIGAQCRQEVKFIVPPYCQRCGLPYSGPSNIQFQCSNCRQMDLHFSYARAAVAAQGLVLELIHRYKYRQALWCEPFLAGLLIQQAAPVLRQESWDMIVPVPLHPRRQAERQFNQAERLARRLGAAVGLPVCTRLLRRTRVTRTQTQLDRRQRQQNVHGAFGLVPGADPTGRRIVLVDDVLTTGATTNACARVLVRAGARKVCVWTVARGLLP